MSLVGLVDLQRQCMSLQEAIERSLELISFQFSPKAKKVAIKPNLCYYWDYSTGETTDPKFISALIDVIRKSIPDADISVVESDASAMKCKHAFKVLGYEKMAEAQNVRLTNLSNDHTEEANVQIEGSTHKFLVPKAIAEADIFIGVPKIKYMQQVRLSCALKNIYGCNPYPKKYKYHKWLDGAIVSLNKLMKPDLSIIDGLIVKGIKTLKLGLIMSSTDPVAMDAAASEIAGLNPYSVKHLVLASKEGIGNITFIPRGESLNSFRQRFPRKNTKYKIRQLVSRIYDQLSRD